MILYNPNIVSRRYRPAIVTRSVVLPAIRASLSAKIISLGVRALLSFHRGHTRRRWGVLRFFHRLNRLLGFLMFLSPVTRLRMMRWFLGAMRQSGVCNGVSIMHFLIRFSAVEGFKPLQLI